MSNRESEVFSCNRETEKRNISWVTLFNKLREKNAGL